MTKIPSSALALDVGGKRIGVAVASFAARLPHPLTTLDAVSDSLFADVSKLIDAEAVTVLVVGYPRGMQGQHTAQTAAIEDFVKQMSEHISLPVHFQDEALTSQRAKEELEARGKPYGKGDVDALAATYILEDWLADNPRVGAE